MDATELSEVGETTLCNLNFPTKKPPELLEIDSLGKFALSQTCGQIVEGYFVANSQDSTLRSPLKTQGLYGVAAVHQTMRRNLGMKGIGRLQSTLKAPFTRGSFDRKSFSQLEVF